MGDTLNFHENDKSHEKQLICFLSTFPPRECGIATFCRDLAYAIKRRVNPVVDINVAAINDDATSIYNYNNKVRFSITQNDIEDYIKLAKRINNTKSIKIVSIQHEFGIFGGQFGNFLVPFLETLEKPVVVTFHSILPVPDPYQKKVVQFIIKRSSAVVVMARKAKEILVDNYKAEASKIHYIPHGTPQVPFPNTELEKKKLGLGGKIVLSTFGLLNKGKGIEYVINALPKVVKKYLNVIYLVIGETHPQIRKKFGEEYRNELQDLVKKLGLKNNVKFYNKYLTLQEIIAYLKATDIYVSPGLDPNQIVSGTLSYALACGKPVVSTKFLHAQEVLQDKKGILVDFKESKQFENAFLELLSDNKAREEMALKIYESSRDATWPNVATKYLELFEKITNIKKEENKFPRINLKHLISLTKDVGVIQFSEQSRPDTKSGYTTDDNARALIVTAKHFKLFKSKLSKELANVYLDFLGRMQKENGEFFNYLNEELSISDENAHEDPSGRALWALGVTTCNFNDNLKEKAKSLFEKSIKVVYNFKSLRARAFAILGLYFYNQAFPSENNLDKIRLLANSLVEDYSGNVKEDWKWFEDKLTYSNSTISEALFLAYKITGEQNYLRIAKDSFNFLSEMTFVNGKLMPIGQNGWFSYKGKRSFFDQQPIDASAMTRTCLVAYEVSQEKKYFESALNSFNWFLGKNALNHLMYDESTGGCYDGLSQNSVNVNQGAESTLSYLLARLSMEEVKKESKDG